MPTETAAPVERRMLDFATVSEAIADARRLAEVGYDRAGQWTLAQACDHLSKFMRYSLDGFPRRFLPWPLNSLARMMLLNERTMGRPMPSGMRAPGFLQPSAVETSNADLSRRADHEAVERFAQQFERAEARRATGEAFHPSPIFGLMSPELWMRVHLKHASHHLGFLVPRVP